MKIYIDGELPKSCTFCEFLVHCDACEGYENYCPFIGHVGYDPDDPTTSVGIVSVTPKRERHVECPLEKIPHGEWKELIGSDGLFQCLECKKLSYFSHNFCPNCGADMRPRMLDQAVDGEGNEGNVREGETDIQKAWMPLPEPYKKEGEAE